MIFLFRFHFHNHASNPFDLKCWPQNEYISIMETSNKFNSFRFFSLFALLSPLFRGQLGTLGGNSPWGEISSPLQTLTEGWGRFLPPPSKFHRRLGEISSPPSKFHRRVGEISSPPCRYPPHSPFQILIFWKMLEKLWFKYIWGVGTRVKLPKVKLHESESLGSQN